VDRYGRYRCFEQILHYFWLVRGVFACVIVSVLVRVEKGGEGAEGGLGDLGVHGGLPGGLVPQDLEVERVEEAGFEVVGQAGQDVPGQGGSSSRVVSAA
jgi:hypothetical protein